MLKLRTDCDKCIHNKVCRNKNNPKHAMQKLVNTTYGDGPNDDYGWDVMMKSQNVDVSFSCPDYQEQKPTPKGFA